MTGTAAFGGAGLLIIVGCGTATGCATCADLDGSAAAVPSTTRWLTGVGVVLAASWAPRDHHDASTSTSTTMAKGHFCIVLWPMQLTYRRAQPILRRTPSCVPMAPIMRVQTAAIGRCLRLLLSIDNLHSSLSAVRKAPTASTTEPPIGPCCLRPAYHRLARPGALCPKLR